MTKVAVVTGGALGYKNSGPSIGGAISLRLAKDGYSVIVVDQLRTGEDTVKKIKAQGGGGTFLQGDVTKTEFVKDIVKTAKEKYGCFNVLVNCVARYNKAMATN